MRLFANAVFIIIAAISSPTYGQDDKYPTLEEDQIPCVFEPKDRIVAIGDLHGEFDRTVSIILKKGIIDGNGRFIAKNTDIVFAGDINGKGQDTRLLIELLMQIEHDATEHNSRVHVLLGNHDLKVLWGDLTTTSKQEAVGFADFAETQEAKLIQEEEGITKKKAGFLAAVRGDGEIARWIRSRNMIIQIGKEFFSHGSVRKWISKVSLKRYNATARAFVRNYQGVGEKPAKKYRWVVFSELSSAWDRKILEADLKKSTVEKMKQDLGVDHLFFGHKPAPENGDGGRNVEILYDGAVYLIDTGITDRKTGSASAVEIVNGQVMVENNIPNSNQATHLRKTVEDAVTNFCTRLNAELIFE